MNLVPLFLVSPERALGFGLSSSTWQAWSQRLPPGPTSTSLPRYFTSDSASRAWTHWHGCCLSPCRLTAERARRPSPPVYACHVMTELGLALLSTLAPNLFSHRTSSCSELAQPYSPLSYPFLFLVSSPFPVVEEIELEHASVCSPTKPRTQDPSFPSSSIHSNTSGSPDAVFFTCRGSLGIRRCRSLSRPTSRSTVTVWTTWSSTARPTHLEKPTRAPPPLHVTDAASPFAVAIPVPAPSLHAASPKT
jgi:hypothetical protein